MTPLRQKQSNIYFTDNQNIMKYPKISQMGSIKLVLSSLFYVVLKLVKRDQFYWFVRPSCQIL